MPKLYSARKVGEELNLPHHEVIRRIRRGDIEAEKLDWNWIITEKAVAKARKSDWYQRHLAKNS